MAAKSCRTIFRNCSRRNRDPEEAIVQCLPDFQTGGLMDAREYADGKGSVKVRAKIKIKDESTVIIKEIPPTTTTESLLASIEDAVRKGKLKIRSVNDFTSEDVEIEIKAPQGVSAEKLVDALYAFTDCETTINSRIVVIRDNRPVEMTVSEVLGRTPRSCSRISSANSTSKRRSSNRNCTTKRSCEFSSKTAFTRRSSSAARTKQ